MLLAIDVSFVKENSGENIFYSPSTNSSATWDKYYLSCFPQLFKADDMTLIAISRRV